MVTNRMSRLVAVSFAVLLCCCTSVYTAFAEPPSQFELKAGLSVDMQDDSLTATLDDQGILTIGGNGEIPDLNVGNCLSMLGITDASEVKKIIVQPGVTRIGNYAFAKANDDGFDNLEEVDLSAATGLTSIGNRSFFGHKNLTIVSFPENGALNTIGTATFRECSALQSVSLPNTISSMGTSVFYYCTSLEEANIPNSLTNVPKQTFAFTALKSITIPSAIESIGETGAYDGVFSGCAQLETVTFSENSSLTTLYNKTFSGCSSLTSLVLPASLTTIEENAFSGCTNLREASCDSSSVTVGNNAFSDCSNLEKAAIPGIANDIPQGMFYGCSKLETLTLPDAYTSIGAAAFSGCSSLASLSIPETCTSIGDEAFWNCTGISELAFPAALDTVRNSWFSGWTRDQTVRICYGTSFAVSMIEEMIYGGPYPTVVYSPAPGYPKDDEKGSILAEGVSGDCTWRFYETFGIGESGQPNVLVISGNGAMEGGQNPESLTQILNNEVEHVIIEEGVTTLSANLFNKATSLSDISLPASLVSVGNSAFSGASSLKELFFPEGSQLTSIASDSMSQPFSGQTDLVLDFSNCKYLDFSQTGLRLFSDMYASTAKKIILPDGMESLSLGWFDYSGRDDNLDISEVVIPSTLVSVVQGGARPHVQVQRFTACSMTDEVKTALEAAVAEGGEVVVGHDLGELSVIWSTDAEGNAILDADGKPVFDVIGICSRCGEEAVVDLESLDANDSAAVVECLSIELSSLRAANNGSSQQIQALQEEIEQVKSEYAGYISPEAAKEQAAKDQEAAVATAVKAAQAQAAKDKDAAVKAAQAQAAKDKDAAVKAVQASGIKANTMTVKAKTVKAKSTKKTTVKRSKAFTVKNAKGKVTFYKVSGSDKITVTKAGKVKVKKGLKAKKKPYKVKVLVCAAGDKSYAPAFKTVTLKVKVE